MMTDTAVRARFPPEFSIAPPRPAELAIIVPSFNEHGNFEPLVARLALRLEDVAWEVIVVGDDSADSRVAFVRGLGRPHAQVRYLQRIGRSETSSGGSFEIACGEYDISACVAHEVSEGVDLLPAHAMPADPVAMLTVPNLRWVLKGISPSYDWAVIDGFPTAGSGRSPPDREGLPAGHVVTRWGSTPTSAMKVAVGDLRSFGVKLIGSIPTMSTSASTRGSAVASMNHEGYCLKYRRYDVET